MQLPVQDLGQPVTDKIYDNQQYDIKRMLSRPRPFLRVLGPGQWFKNGISITKDESGGYYMDASHVNNQGAQKLLGPLLGPVLDNISQMVNTKR
jgi:hypothetical protein